MLPGFRFLFAATLFTMSILVFGLGATALLRAAHEQFASNPSWHAAPEATFAQQAEAPRDASRDASREASRPVLAMLRFEPPATEQKASDGTRAIDPSAIPPPVEPDGNAALAQDSAAPPAAAKPDMPAAENPAPDQVAAVPSDTPMADATKAASLSDAKVASTEQAATEPVSQPANDAIPTAGVTDAAASSQAAAPGADVASVKVAALDNPSATIEPKPPAKPIGAMPDQAKPDQSAIKKRLRARRAAQRRRMAARAAREALLLAQRQQSVNPFIQSFPQPQPAPIGAAARTR
ncbi:hypothetical protein [Bradyrhizobium erythrophlei]|jgi:hypothetical protein|uniref:Uncharacterized protein n=1 Tax=Bradyrhizobium erythrophlei TaxID=1437360 RepID=A0A1M5H103_9BRAD|nr:hypothetical protein [Bradyrhizobium erythrophlei]SHG09669.1 hypothetical protein SAMN05444169_0512 [Bradyrhizobium erythrophlei]